MMKSESKKILKEVEKWTGKKLDLFEENIVLYAYYAGMDRVIKKLKEIVKWSEKFD